MTTLLSRYSKSKDVSRSKVEYTSEKEYTKALAKGQKAITADDFERPYSFREWKDRNIGVIPAEEYNQYQKYLREWYDSRLEKTDIKNLLQNDYIRLIRDLKLILRDDELNKWLIDIDFNNKTEVSEAIPYLARKLKEIAIYLVNKKDAIKKAKLKYNMSGTNNALEKLFYEYLLKAFTQRDYVLNVPEQELWNTFPHLSAVKDNFQIFVDELYDDTSYFDHDPSMPVSAYYDLSNPAVTAYYDKLGFPVDDLNWLYETGAMPIIADNPLLWSLAELFNQYNTTSIDEFPLSAFDDINRTRLLDYYKMDLAAKYLGEQQYYLSGGYYLAKTKTFNYPFENGNNWFYWPSGEYGQEVPYEFYDPILINDTNLVADGAVAANTYEEADKIFIERRSQIDGAWLKLSTTTTTQENMSAVMQKYPDENWSGFQFRYPYPDYGLSAIDLDYTGPGFENIKKATFNILDKDVQKAILGTYWKYPLTAYDIESIPLQETRLIESGAHASQYFDTADKIFIRDASHENKIHDSNPNSVYVDGFKRAWLYKFLKTELPLQRGQTKIIWPVKTYNETEDINFNVLTSQCMPIHLSSVDVRYEILGARAGYGLYDSDVIYKLDSPEGHPIECAFLSGVPIDGLGKTTWTANTTGCIQPSFTLHCQPGQYNTFIWQDDAKPINETNIKHHEHQIDCPYLKEKHTSIYNSRGKTFDQLKDNLEYGLGEWQKCRCKSILYSPIGHPGEKYNDYGRMTDIVFVDTMFPSAFNFTDWRGTDGLPYDQSSDFAWFQLTGNQIQPDVGWGNGRWVAGDGTLNFTLSTGVLYKMLRTNLQRNVDDVFTGKIPDLYIKQKYDNVPQPVWYRTILQPDGTWLKTNKPSDMVINPGDYILYDHMDSLWYCLTANDRRQPAIFSEPFRSIENPFIEDDGEPLWANISFASVDEDIYLLWPDIVYEKGPEYLRTELDRVNWVIKRNGDIFSESSKTTINEYYSFNASLTGTYTFEATGYFEDDTQYIPTILDQVDIIPVPVLSTLSGDIDIKTIYNDTLNTVWCHDLKGWDYNTNTFDTSSMGGRPLWVSAVDDDSFTTKFKGTKVWGGGIVESKIDDYSLLSQPPLAYIDIEQGDYIDYRYHGAGELVWIEPINITIDEETRQWCKLAIKPHVTHPLNSYLCNIDKELIISATDEPSDISFYQTCDSKLLVNYWANEPFTWTQELTDSTVGLPPTGGIWVPWITGDLIEPVVPYTNLTNRHFPTIATVPYIGNLYSEADVGGYFTPKCLGASIYVGKQYENKLDTTYISNTSFRELNQYTSDYGLTNNMQLAPVKTEDVNANWMKAPLTQGARAGFVDGVREHQEFVPYQTKYESNLKTNVGLRFITDDYDPWEGEKDNEWRDETNFPPNFRDEYPIEEWYRQFPQLDKKISTWKTDIFGNNYVLLKDRDINSIYYERLSAGDLWLRNALGKIGTGNELLEDVYNTMAGNSSLYMELTSNQIRNFDIFYDVILFETTNHLALQKLNMDENGGIFSIGDDLRPQGGMDLIHYFKNHGKYWHETLAPETNWYHIAMSVSGKHQTAVVYNGGIWYSSDYGYSWQQSTSVGNKRWYAIDLSASGKYQIACVYNASGATNGIWYSSDYGENWQQSNAPIRRWRGVAMSADGKIQTAVVRTLGTTTNDHGIWLSNDYGHTWTRSPGMSALPRDGNGGWHGVDMSWDGKYQTAVLDLQSQSAPRLGGIWISSDYGHTWTQTSVPDDILYHNVAISSNARHQIVAGRNNSGTWISNDYGNTWFQRNIGTNWDDVAISSTGQYQTAVNGGIWYSHDYGDTWEQSDAPSAGWWSVDMSANGVYQMAAIIGSGGGIWRSIADEVKEWHAGTWLFEDTKMLTLCNVIYDGEDKVAYPQLYSYNLDNGHFHRFYNGYNDSSLLDMVSAGLTRRIEKPVFTYNTLTKTYNVTFTDDAQPLIIVNNIGKQNNIYKSSIISILPSS